jgi:hypothetical protein
MLYIEAPNSTFGAKHTLFLAGGITGCPDWQTDICQRLKVVDDLTVLNPRRANFPIDDPSAAQTQIMWEYLNLTKADAILFWFPKETLCPIVLYELGFQMGRRYAWLPQQRDKLPTLFIGAHPEYQRRQDVVIQSKLVGHTGKIYDSLESLGSAVLEHFNY